MPTGSTGKDFPTLSNGRQVRFDGATCRKGDAARNLRLF